MNPTGTPCCEVTRHSHRIVRVDVHFRPVTAREAYHFASDEIDGGKQDHGPSYPYTIRTKFESILRPAVEDFSGWNWTAKTLSLQTVEGKLRA